MTYEENLNQKYDLSTEAGKLMYQKDMTIESLEGYNKSLSTTIAEFKNGEIDEEDFLDTILGLSAKIVEAVAIVQKYHQ